MILDIASIVFICVTANHLGLISAIVETVTKRHQLPVVSCPKCFSFWCTLGYMGCHGMATCPKGVITMLAVSFLSSYAALWLELVEGYIDTLYMKCYGKIYANPDDAVTSDTDGGDSAGSVSELSEK